MRTAISPRLAISTLEISGTAHRNPSGPVTSPSRGTRGQDWWRLLRRARGFVGFLPCGGGLRCSSPSALVRRAQGGAARLALPQRGDRDAYRREKLAQQREAQADHVVEVAIDRRDERAAEAVDGEGARDDERFSRRDIGLDLLVGEIGEVHRRRRRGADRAERAREPVPRVERPGATTHLVPALERLGGVPWLAEDAALELEHRVATEHELGSLRRAREDVLGFRA